MKLESFSQWLKNDRVTTKATPDKGEFLGIAIGPDSEESAVLVDGRLLVAGHVMPLRGRSYSLERYRKRVSPDLDSIATLQVALIENPEELAASAAFLRPPADSFATLAIAAAGSGSVYFPFCGRRLSAFSLYSGNAVNGSWSYSVQGVRFSRSKAAGGDGAIFQWTVKTEAAPQLDGANHSYAFYVGGLDEAEQWDALLLKINNASGITNNWDVDFTGTGEIGAL